MLLLSREFFKGAVHLWFSEFPHFLVLNSKITQNYLPAIAARDQNNADVLKQEVVEVNLQEGLVANLVGHNPLQVVLERVVKVLVEVELLGWPFVRPKNLLFLGVDLQVVLFLRKVLVPQGVAPNRVIRGVKVAGADHNSGN